MSFELSALLGKLMGVALPPLMSLQPGFYDLATHAAAKAVGSRASVAEVANWRFESVAHLDMPTSKATLLLLGDRLSRTPRCMKLNNYWCIKQAGWQGELGADVEGHVAFESAEAGARAAAILLRRYYIEFKRRSALSIVSRWAPNRCLGSIALPSLGSAPAAPSPARWQSMSKEQRNRTFDRLLANRRRFAEARYRMTLQAIAAAKAAPTARPARPMSPLPRARTRPRPPAKDKSVEAARPVARAPITCALEAARIASYAQRAIKGIAAASGQDLELFDDEGLPTWRLGRLMENMASVEVGPQKVRRSLVLATLSALAVGADGREPRPKEKE